MMMGTEQSLDGDESLARGRPLVLSLLLTGLAALGFWMSWFFAAAPLTGVEPSAAFIDCGPALVGRPTPLPDSSCAGAYGEVIFLSMLCGLAGALVLAAAVVVVARQRADTVRPRSPQQEAATK
jgi:hypothetical protein